MEFEDYHSDDFSRQLTTQNIARFALGEFSVPPDDNTGEQPALLNPDTPPSIGGVAVKLMIESNSRN